MEKNKILSKFNFDIKDYNNELEKILENKLFSFDVKNLLLSMLYKIENAYKDYKTVKVEVKSKREYIENILRIIQEKCIKIFLVKSGTEESEELEKNNILYKIDKENGEIICFQNELVLLSALIELDFSNNSIDVPYEYAEEPYRELINIGNLCSETEVIRDFNGWSWDIVKKEIFDIEYNFMFQNLLLLNGRANIHRIKYPKLQDIILKMCIQKYLSNEKSSDYLKKFKKIKQEKQEKLNLINNKRDFLNRITEEKREYTKQIEKIDKILNNNDLLKKEYYIRNEKLPNREKIFSVSYLVGILDKERLELLDKIDECNKMILPKEFVEHKNKLIQENEFLANISNKITIDDIIHLSSEFINYVIQIIKEINEENKAELIEWIYKIRYYRWIPICKEKCVKDIKELNDKFKELIKLIIKKAQKLKIWDTLSENDELTYQVLKEVFETKIIYMQNINIQCKYIEKILHIEYYDDTIIENTIKINIDSVRIKKKIKLFI